jgi:hypothetical protein
MRPATALSKTMNWTGLSHQRFRRPIGVREGEIAPCQRSREWATGVEGDEESRETVNAAEWISDMIDGLMEGRESVA